MRYMGEPYVLAGDVYGADPYVGRAGWTWYTGSAGWMKYVLTEDFFGIKKRGKRLYLSPCFPSSFSRLSAEMNICGHSISVEYLRSEECGLYLEGKRIECLNLDEIGEKVSVLCRFV